VSDALRFAERVSFETFVACYVRELGGGAFHRAERWMEDRDPAWPGRAWVLELELPCQEIRLAIEVVYRSAVGGHRLGIVRQQRGDCSWEPGDEIAIVWALVRELYLSAARKETDGRAQEIELFARFLQSIQVMARYLEARGGDEEPSTDRFIDSEQSLLFGHWRHPTPKSRQGMTDWQHASSAPELRGSFKLHFFAVSRALVQQGSALECRAEDAVNTLLSEDPASREPLATARSRGEVLVPVHPLQVDWLLHQPHVQEWLRQRALREVGRLGPWFTATSSVRTVYSEEAPFMLKLSIPVKITNSLRFNRRHELLAGVLMARLMEKIRVRGPLKVVADPAYLTVALDEGRETGFEAVVRTNPFVKGQDSGVHSVAALTQRSLPRRASRLRALIEGLSLTEGRNQRTVSLDWFVRYLKCAVEPLIRLYDEHGIALEAHQQNVLLDVSGGYPRGAYYRDNQGYYLSASASGPLQRLEPSLAQHPELFFDDVIIRRRFSYYLIENQLFALVHRLGCEGLLDEEASLTVSRSRLKSLHATLGGRGRALVSGILHARELPCKANLLTRARDLDELGADHEGVVYVNVENPLRRPRSFHRQELEVA
jgi:siderophore synthetase component